MSHHLPDAARDFHAVLVANVRPDGKAHGRRRPILGNAHRGEDMRRLHGADEAGRSARHREAREIKADEQVLAMQAQETDIERVGQAQDRITVAPHAAE